MSLQPETSSAGLRAVVALGANLGDRRATLEQAVALMKAEIGVVAARSAWHGTPALIHPDDPAQSYPEFLNGAVLICTLLEADAILATLHRIEARLGRDRSLETARWRPRVIDLDLIALEGQVVDDGSLRLCVIIGRSFDPNTGEQNEPAIFDRFACSTTECGWVQ